MAVTSANKTTNPGHQLAALADFLQPAFEYLPVGVVLVGPDGAIALANREAERLFQYSAAELIGLSVDALVPDSVRTRHAEVRERFLEEPDPSRMGGVRELLARRKDGSELPVEVWLATIKARGTRFVVASIVDITDRKRRTIAPADAASSPPASQAVSNDNPRFQHLVDAVPTPIGTINADGAVEFANAAWRNALDCATVGTPWMSACHPDDREAAGAAMGTALHGQTGFDVELRLRQPDGTYRWWVVAATPHPKPHGASHRFVVTCSDATSMRSAQQALRDAGARLIASQEAVRSHIARELHDDIGQQVVVLATRLETVMQQGDASAGDLRSAISQAQDGLQELARSVHNLSHELHPAKLRLLGLTRTIAGLAREVAADRNVHVGFEVDGQLGELSEERALCLFRVAQEALQNSLKHSAAKAVEVSLAATPTHVSLRISDDGIGFDSLALSSGLGLLTMRERVELIGGTLRIHTAPASGTTIEVMVPVMTDVSPSDAEDPGSSEDHMR